MSGKTNHHKLRHIVPSPAVGGAAVSWPSLDPDPETRLAEAYEGRCQQEEPGDSWHRPSGQAGPWPIGWPRRDGELQLGRRGDTEVRAPDRDRRGSGHDDVAEIPPRPGAVGHHELQRNARCLMTRE